jgi:hypothetical protein
MMKPSFVLRRQNSEDAIEWEERSNMRDFHCDSLPAKASALVWTTPHFVHRQVFGLAGFSFLKEMLFY